MLNRKRYGAEIRAAFFVGLLISIAVPAQATEWPKSDIPPDPSVTFGVLQNGMRYAIKHNNTPTGEVSIRFRIGAGSLQESADQRGLAHFLEHMAFRGSTHVGDGEIDKTLERLGLRFGADTNASTGQDQTVYRFDLPRADDVTVDTALTFTREIASNLNLDPAAAKTEAGVVLAELNLRGLPSLHALQAQLDFLLQDTHATALANGDPAIIGQAPAALIRDYYQAYYRPERAVLIVVGDVDPAKMEDKIKERFSDWKGNGVAGRDPHIVIPRSRDLEVKVFAESGAPPRISLTWVKLPDSKPDDQAQERSSLIEDVGLRIFNHRLRDAAASVARPFIRAGVSQEQTLQAAKLVTFSIGYESDHWQAALDAADRIRLSVLRSGVDQAEVDRVVAELHTSSRAESMAASTQPSTSIANSILEDISAGDVYTSSARDLAASDQYLKGLTAGEVTRALRNVFHGSGPLIFVSGPQPIDGGEQAVKTAFREIEKSAASPPTAAIRSVALSSWPYNDFGKPGVVVNTELLADVGTTFVQFANGVRLTIRPSKSRSNQVLVSVKVGGGRLDLPKERLTAAWAAGGLVAGGLEAASYIDMQRVLTSKIYSVNFGVGEDGFVFAGSTTPGDIDTQLQIFAAYLQAPAFRPEGFEQVRSNYAARLRRVGDDPAGIMNLKAPEILHGGDKRWASPSAQEVQAAKVDELRSMLTPAFAKGAIDVTIVGDITTEKAVQAVAATFGAFSQRASSRQEVNAENSVHLPLGVDLPIAIPGSGSSGQEIVTSAWPTHGRFSDLRDNAALELMSDVMEARLFERLRGLGTVYVAQVGSTSSKVFDYGYIQALAQLPPDKSQQFYDAIQDIVSELKAGKFTSDDLERAKNPALQQLRKAQETNQYWLSALDGAQESRGKLDLARTYAAALEQVTPSDIVAVANKYLMQSRVIRLAVGS